MHRSFIAAAALAAAPLCQAGDEYQVKTLSIGDAAPALDIAHWLKGAQVPEFETGKVYVVEFWATWCGPCRASMPHLSELQASYDDYGVTFIGVSDEAPQKVVEFFSKTNEESGKLWTESMQYTVVTDPDKSTHQAYMSASNTRGIPAAFIVGKDQKIEWIGRPNYPKGDIDRVIEAVAHDSWDRTAFLKIYDLRKRVEKEFASGDPEQAVALGNELLALDPAGAPIYQEMIFWATLQKLDRPVDAYALAKDLLKANWDSAGYLNGFAWRVATEDGIKTRDLELALKAALRANDLTGSNDPAILDTVARIFYDKGDVKSALKWQRKAVAAVKDDDKLAEELRAALEKYEKQ